jgi:hypothetical protein
MLCSGAQYIDKILKAGDSQLFNESCWHLSFCVVVGFGGGRTRIGQLVLKIEPILGLIESFDFIELKCSLLFIISVTVLVHF